MSSLVEKIKQVADIVDIVEAYGVSLRKSGREYKGLCPFHAEKTPSFFVNREKGLYHCFGCGASGDVIDFVMHIENVDFKEAIRILADRYGIEYQEQIKKNGFLSASEIQHLFSIAVNYYQKTMSDNALQYLKERGINKESIERYKIGYADKEKPLVKLLQDKYPTLIPRMQKLGLITKNGRDRFSGRIIIPIRDIKGNIIGINARTITNQSPKYLLTPNNKLFEKGKTFFGLHFALPHIRQSKTLTLMEGNIDVILAHQHGINTAIAPMGTAFTQWHWEFVKYLRVEKMIVWLDNDKAGKQAGLKLGVEGLTRGIDVEIVLPTQEGSDPADVLTGKSDSKRLTVQELLALVYDNSPVSSFVEKLHLTKSATEKARELLTKIITKQDNPFAKPTQKELFYASVVKATLLQHPDFVSATPDELLPYAVHTGKAVHNKTVFLKVFLHFQILYNRRMYQYYRLQGDEEKATEHKKLLLHAQEHLKNLPV